MVFSEEIFLFLFLMVVLIVYYNPVVRGRTFRNTFLFLASIVFYAWGGPTYALIMLGSICANWFFGRLISAGVNGTAVAACAAVFNIGLLFIFKYLDFAAANLNRLFALELPLPGIALPIGISFFTFQGLSYVIDVKRDPSLAQRSLLDVGLYIACFPQLIAGPIVRYETVAREIRGRKENWEDFTEGFRRFLWGAAKKVLVANQLAPVADAAFGADSLTVVLAWLGAAAYTLQIYFDFSGYSDMAIGLGRMFGFHFLENFNYPYAARGITDFWRRWHISLSSWFRDYVYIPLGGNRVGPGRHLFNLAVVWLLTGVWHGASWNFVLWGMTYFVLLMVEKYTGLDKKLPALLCRGYTLLAVSLCWVLFRAEDLPHALTYLRAMFGMAPAGFWDGTATVQLTNHLIYFLLGVLCFPIVPALKKTALARRPAAQWAAAAFQFGVLLLTVGFVLSSTYDPFIYFNF